MPPGELATYTRQQTWELLKTLDDTHKGNEDKIDQLTTVFSWSCSLLIVQVVLWVVALATG